MEEIKANLREMGCEEIMWVYLAKASVQ